MGKRERRIVRDKTTECWEWQAGVREFGYGQISLTQSSNKVTLPAHRVMWQMFYGAIPAGMCICHHCDNPRCVNPEHLFLGTRADNNKDMFAKGRARPGPKTKGYRRPGVSGERSGAAKLTWEQVRAMRTEYARGGISGPALARKYGVGKTAVGNLLAGQTWREEENT